MFFIEFTYDFCKQIVLEFFYVFSNDLFHEIYLIVSMTLICTVGGGVGGLEHRRQDHRPGAVGWAVNTGHTLGGR